MQYNLAKIRGKTAYTTQEVSQLLDVGSKTIFRWFKEGLELLDPVNRPRLVMGNDLKKFLQAKREAKQVKLNWNEFYCLRCRKAVLAKRGSEHTERTGKNIGRDNRNQEIICGLCKGCGSPITRFL